MGRYVGAIDQGTTSTRFIVFDRQGDIVAVAQREHAQIFPQPGWVEHDAAEIWRNTEAVIDEALVAARLTPADIISVGIANQRETTVVWDRRTGAPLHNALVWQDTRVDSLANALAADEAAGGRDRLRATTGLPLASYFSGLKLRWLLDNVPGLRGKAEAGDALFGTIDSWIVWNLTGGVDGGRHLTDVTNASRTQLLDITRLAWDTDILALFDVPAAMLPEVVSSSEVYGEARGFLAGVPVAGILGDQQAALVGQTCFAPGEAKNTYGTGSFALINTGEKPFQSTCGLVTTVAYQFGTAPAVYALEGSIAVTGALVQWLRDNLGIIGASADIEPLARSVDTNGDVYIVPAFSGLYAPHWRPDARGVVCGLTRFATKAHIARAALEASAYQTHDVLQAMAEDSGIPISELRADGGMAANELLMQFQSDILGVPVVRPKVVETTALGAAYAAGLATGYWASLEDLRRNWGVDQRWQPTMPAAERNRLLASWNKALERSLGWVE